MTEEVSIALSTSKASSFQKREREEVDVDALLAESKQLAFFLSYSFIMHSFVN